jgi:hypothetical protein
MALQEREFWQMKQELQAKYMTEGMSKEEASALAIEKMQEWEQQNQSNSN